MSYRDFAKSEIDILRDNIRKSLDKFMDSDEDPDTIGTEAENSNKMIELLDISENVINYIEDSGYDTDYDVRFIKNIINDIFNGIPLSELNSYEEKPEEWEAWSKFEKPDMWINSRYFGLIRREINITGGYKKIIYSDPHRLKFYNLITNEKIGVSKLDAFEDGRNINYIQTMLDQLLPIEFPYYVKQDHIKIYVERFDVSLQEGAEEVHTLALTHYLRDGDDRPTRIMKFFDISEKGINEIDIKAYLTRRQIFENSVEVKKEDDADSHENDVL